MKRKEKMADESRREWVKSRARKDMNREPTEMEINLLGLTSYNVGYLAGFEKAREMAASFMDHNFRNSYSLEKLRTLGEDEVE